jgi:hypothetical protein
MSWKPYNNAAGERVPSVTTITGRFKDGGALIAWAWQQGRDGKDFRETKTAAADAGTCAHAMIEAHIKGVEFVREGWSPESLAKAQQAFEAFQTWADGTKLVPHASEVRLVSEAHQFGGTIDCMARVGNSLCILDWKTGGLYADHLYQVGGGYQILWNENHPDEPITGGFHLCRFSRDNADFCHSYFGELEGAKRGFLLMRELYGIDAALKKRVK